MLYLIKGIESADILGFAFILYNTRIYCTALVKRIWLALCSPVTQ